MLAKHLFLDEALRLKNCQGTLQLNLKHLLEPVIHPEWHDPLQKLGLPFCGEIRERFQVRAVHDGD